MKRKLTVSLIAILCILLIGSSALAVTFRFSFENVTSSRDTGTAVITNPTSSYKITLESSSNVSSDLIFGARPRSSLTKSSAGNYHLYNSTGTWTRSLNRTYGNSDKTDNIFLRCKKDSASGYTGVLNVTGSFLV